MTDPPESEHRPSAPQSPRDLLLPAADHEPSARRSVLLEVVTRVVYPSVLVVALYLVLAGADRTGGGFTAGLVAGAGLSLRYLAGGPHEFGTAMPVNPAGLLGAGLAVMGGYGLVGIIAGDAALASTTWSTDLPVVGHAETSSTLVFDIGVALLVMGLVVDVLRVMAPGLSPDSHDDGPSDDDEEGP